MISWWEHLSWSDAALYLCGLGFIVSMIVAMFAGDPDHDVRLRGSHEDQFANTSRRHYVSRRGLK